MARREVARLTTYATLVDEDVRVAANQERKQLAQALNTTLAENTAWLAPEIIAIGRDKAERALAQTPGANAVQAHCPDAALRPTHEAPRAKRSSERPVTCWRSRRQHHGLLSAERSAYPSIALSDGTKVLRLDRCGVLEYGRSPIRADRKKVFDAVLGRLEQVRERRSAQR